MDGIPLIITIFLALGDRIAEGESCNTKFSDQKYAENFGITASSETPKNKASGLFTVGWCAATSNGSPDVEVDFKQAYGVSSILVSGPTNRDSDPYPTNVLVKYVPNGGDDKTFVDFPLQEGKLEIKLTEHGVVQSNFGQGIAIRKLQFTIQSFHGDACLKIDLLGCSINDLCPGGCHNGGTCSMQDTCSCATGYLGNTCDQKACQPADLGLATGVIGADQIQVSSQDPVYTKAEIGNSVSKKGWCPSGTDHSPWVQIKLDQPKAVSVFSFTWSAKGNHQIMTEFEFQYIAPIDSSKRFRTFATEIPAMNSTHIFTVTTQPVIVTDTIRIIPSKWDGTPCFKLELKGCDPKELCTSGWCNNGGTCMGENVCLCPTGFVGSRCEKPTNQITVTNMTFVKIEHNIIVTTSTTLEFLVTGNVQLEVVANRPVVTITGNQSFITLNQTTGVASCLTNVNLCTNGFTFTIDVNFGHLLDNTFIVSSGGHLPGHSGITLYYTNKQLIYIVSTTTHVWTLAVSYVPVLHKWQHFEITWNKHLGVELLVDGHSLGTNSRPSNQAPANKVVDLCIGCSHSSTTVVNINMQITAIHSWTIDRTELVNAGVKDPPATATTPMPSTKSTPTSAPSTTAATIPSTTITDNVYKVGSNQTAMETGSTLPYTETTVLNNEITKSAAERRTEQPNTKASISNLSSRHVDETTINSRSTSRSKASTFSSDAIPDVSAVSSSLGSTDTSTTALSVASRTKPDETTTMDISNSKTPDLKSNTYFTQTSSQTITKVATRNQNLAGTTSALSSQKLKVSLSTVSTSLGSTDTSTTAFSVASKTKPNGTTTMDISNSKTSDLKGNTYFTPTSSQTITKVATSNQSLAGTTSALSSQKLKVSLSTVSISLGSTDTSTTAFSVASRTKPDETTTMDISKTPDLTSNISFTPTSSRTITKVATNVAGTTTSLSSQNLKNSLSTVSSRFNVPESSTSSQTGHMTKRAPQTTSPPLFLEYNLTFVSITDNILITPTFNFTLHNKPTLELQNNSHTALVLNCSEQQYVELPEQGIPCLENMMDCKIGFTFNLEVLFTELEPAKKAYILSSGGDVSGTSGMAIYIQNSQLLFGVKQGIMHWTGTYNMTGIIKTDMWYKLEVSWSAQKGVLVLIDGYQVIRNNNPTPSPATGATHPVLIGKTEGSNETTCMKVKDLFSWTAEREVLVDHGIVQAPKTTVATTPTTTPTTTKATTTIPTTTQIPVPTYTWNFTTVTDNIIIGNHYNLTIHGSPVVSNGGIQINSSTHYIEFGSHEHNCLIKPESCAHGLTIVFTIQFNKFEENTYFFTSGGQLPDGVGLAVIYRFGKVQFILTTVSQSWFINCGKNHVRPNMFHTVMLSWQLSTGLEVFINNILIEATKVPIPHQSVLLNATTVYIGKQPTTSIKVDFILQTITIWYVHIDILVEQGKCEPPYRPTTAPPTQSTKATTVTPKPSASTSRATFTTLVTKSSTQQCPAGCVSITTAQPTSKNPVSITTKTPVTTPKPPATTAEPPVTATSKKPSTPEPTTKPKPSATTSSFVPTPDTATPPPPTTRKPIPDFSVIPTLHVTVETDKNAYIACVFKPTAQTDVQIKASLYVEGKVRLVLTVGGKTGVAMFAVSKVDMFLYQKEIQCSVSAHYIGSVLTTTTYYSNKFTPTITVSPGRVIVVEGHSTEFVTITSTAPPQFYCCSGCKGQCQVHIVGTFHYERRFQKCGKNVIAQAVIESTKPPNFNEQICGYALTVTNWNQHNKIQIKATIDGQRDGDHTNHLDIIANVYNQPQTAQITVKPNSFTVSAVQVTVKDNDHSPNQCKSVNDPHMTTFDGQRYNNMNEGEFILYRHTSLPFEVRAFYYKCSKRSHATCNCAVAVKSGDDVIAVTGCQGTGGGGHSGQGHGIGLMLQQLFGNHGHAHGHNQDLARTPMTIQIYKNGELTPGTYIRRIGCGQKYEIELPTGMVVTVQQSWKPFINIWIKASSTDRGNSEGLCGNFDGSRSNDLKPNVNSVINKWKAPGDNFFYGVGVSSHSVTSSYCSCVKDKNRVCLAGLGAMRCAVSRYDITVTLVKQAKRPVLSRHKRQANTEPEATVIPPDGTDVSLEEAEKKCRAKIMDSSITKSCVPILTSNLTEQIDNCAHDYNATGNFEWSTDALRDIIVDCVDAANTIRVANETDNTNVTDEVVIPDNIDEILDNLDICVEDCGENGNCTDGVCVCDAGYSGISCDISKEETIPTVISAPFLCDIIDTSDCMAAPVYGDNFVESETLTCHYEFVQVGETVVSTGEKGHERAVYISINHVTCPLPRLQSARISVSNDGNKRSNGTTTHVVYSPVCFECTETPTCTRKENNCFINDVCYESETTRPGDVCQICRPVANSTAWSRNNLDECISSPVAVVKNNDKEKTQILALAITCGVLAAIIFIGCIYCIRVRSGKSSKKTEFGEYDVTGAQKVHRDPYFTATNNPSYEYDEKL